MLSPRQRALVDLAREDRSITLDQLLTTASTSPIDPATVSELARAAGLDVSPREDDTSWEDLEKLSEHAPRALQIAREQVARPEAEFAPGSPATLYLREISRTQLLSADEEVSLARQIEAGREARQRLEQDIDDAAEQARLEEVVRLGDAARRRMIEANLRLVVSIAKRYVGRGLPFLDLVQEGNIGLHRGVDRFDWRRGFRFSTYAYWWIRQAITRAVAMHGRTIRLPSHAIEQLSRIYNAAHELQSDLGRAPTVPEIASRVGVEPDKVRLALVAARVPLSLDTPIGLEADATLASFIADTVLRSPAEEVEEAVLSETLDAALNQFLTPREAAVLRLRFGLSDGRERTFAEVAKEIGLSREAVRLIEADALRKLRTSPLRERFAEYT